MNLTCAKVWRGLAIAALLMGGAARQIAAQQTLSEPNLVGVRIVREDGTVLKDAPAGLAVEVGKPLDRTQVAASLRTLYKSGDYANLRAETVPVEAEYDWISSRKKSVL